jgi:hypothetical protein
LQFIVSCITDFKRIKLQCYNSCLVHQTTVICDFGVSEQSVILCHIQLSVTWIVLKGFSCCIFLYLSVLSDSFPFLFCQINHLLIELACSVRWFLQTSQYPTFIRMLASCYVHMSLICKMCPIATALYFQYITNKIKSSINQFNSLRYCNKLN